MFYSPIQYVYELCVQLCMHICMYVGKHVYIHTCTCRYACINNIYNMHVYIYAYIHIPVCLHLRVCVHVCVFDKCWCLFPLPVWLSFCLYSHSSFFWNALCPLNILSKTSHFPKRVFEPWWIFKSQLLIFQSFWLCFL